MHPSEVLFQGEAIPVQLPVCDHYAGSEKLMRKSLALQQELGPVFDITFDCEDGAAVGQEREHAELCAQLVNSPRRITKPAYRASGASQWQEVEWDWALDQIAQRIKQTRDANWVEIDDQSRIVRHTPAIASIGSAALDNEECSLLVKALRSMGLLYLEHQARI